MNGPFSAPAAKVWNPSRRSAMMNPSACNNSQPDRATNLARRRRFYSIRRDTTNGVAVHTAPIMAARQMLYPPKRTTNVQSPWLSRDGRQAESSVIGINSAMRYFVQIFEITSVTIDE